MRHLRELEPEHITIKIINEDIPNTTFRNLPLGSSTHSGQSLLQRNADFKDTEDVAALVEVANSGDEHIVEGEFGDNEEQRGEKPMDTIPPPPCAMVNLRRRRTRPPANPPAPAQSEHAQGDKDSQEEPEEKEDVLPAASHRNAALELQDCLVTLDPELKAAVENTGAIKPRLLEWIPGLEEDELKESWQ